MAYYKCGSGKRKSTISYYVWFGAQQEYRPLGLYYENDVFEFVGYTKSSAYYDGATIKALKKVKLVDIVGHGYGNKSTVTINGVSYSYQTSTFNDVVLNAGDTLKLNCILGSSGYSAGNTLVFEL